MRLALNSCGVLYLTFAFVVCAVKADPVPDPRTHHALVYHAGHERVYLIGGSTRRGADYHYFDDMWSWDGAAWTRHPPLPFPRSSHRVVYDSARDALILFGGGFGQAVRADGVVWEWRGDAWRAVGGSVRAGSAEPELCYDPGRERVVIFGGWDAGNAYRGDTWEWDGDELVRVDTAGPTPRAGHVFVFDPTRRRCLLFGGQDRHAYLADTWEWDGAAWRHLELDGPPARWFAGAAADPANGRVILFGGRGPDAPVRGRDETGNYGDTWAWDGRRWQRLARAGPPARMGTKLLFTGNGVLLFGGRQETADGWQDLDDTWELREASWVRHR